MTKNKPFGPFMTSAGLEKEMHKGRRTFMSFLRSVSFADGRWSHCFVQSFYCFIQKELFRIFCLPQSNPGSDGYHYYWLCADNRGNHFNGRVQVTTRQRCFFSDTVPFEANDFLRIPIPVNVITWIVHFYGLI